MKKASNDTSVLWYRAALCSITLGAAAGCGGWTEAHRDNAMSEFRSTALPKAAFSLGCEAEKMKVELVPQGDPFPDGALVEGCGQRATYAKTRAGWVMESGPGR